MTSRSPVQRPNLTKLQNASKQSMKRCTSASQLKLSKLSHERASHRDSEANDLLLEEVAQLCNVCSRTITEDDIACIKCNLISHLNCMDLSNSDECLACAAVESQQNPNKDCQNKLANSQETNAQLSMVEQLPKIEFNRHESVVPSVKAPTQQSTTIQSPVTLLPADDSVTCKNKKPTTKSDSESDTNVKHKD